MVRFSERRSDLRKAGSLRNPNEITQTNEQIQASNREEKSEGGKEQPERRSRSVYKGGSPLGRRELRTSTGTYPYNSS